MRYSCGFNGQCEANPYGEYASLTQCLHQCQSISNKDIQDLIYQYSPLEAIHLSPTDQRRIINRLTNNLLHPHPNDLVSVLTALSLLPEQGISALISIPATWPYMESLYSFDEIVEAHYETGDMIAYERLNELLEAVDYNYLYHSALNRGHCDVADLLEPNSDLTEDEIQDYTHNSPYDCVTAHMISVYSSFDGYWNEVALAEASADHNDLPFFLRLLRLYANEELMAIASVHGGLPFLERLALNGYYLTLAQASELGLPYLYLTLESYDGIPEDWEIEQALLAVQDIESCDLLHSLLRDDSREMSCDERFQ